MTINRCCRLLKKDNNAINGYEARRAYEDKQDLLAMVLLQYVTAFIKQNRLYNDDKKIVTERLKALLHNLEKVSE